MARDSVGEIALDLSLNSNGFKKQLSGIADMAKKAGAMIASAFAVKKLVEFGKSCIELGSDLSEVQNVVDVTFPQMSAQVDQFAKSAAASFGLSETMAKKYTGTFGAMAKAFGFTEEQAYQMGTSLTGLAGDVASFYNISQDEAYTKLKSVFTGETESLKDLGVVMTQTALDSYALANGFGKTTSQMSEAEKVALRYQFVQNQLTAAAGDFARTSDGWANQVRILSLQFDSLKATIGQGLINLLTPVIKVINIIIGKLTTLANVFNGIHGYDYREEIFRRRQQCSQRPGPALPVRQIPCPVPQIRLAAPRRRQRRNLSSWRALIRFRSSPTAVIRILTAVLPEALPAVAEALRTLTSERFLWTVPHWMCWMRRRRRSWMTFRKPFSRRSMRCTDYGKVVCQNWEALHRRLCRTSMIILSHP